MQPRIYLILSMALLAIMVSTICPQTSKKIPPPKHATPMISKGENVSSNIDLDLEIQRLMRESKERKDKVEFWDRWNIRFLWAAGAVAMFGGIVAISLAITAIGVSTSNQKLLTTSEGLDRAKDDKLTLDLRTKDGEIAEAQRLAGIANQHAAELNTRNLELEKSLAPRQIAFIEKQGKSNIDPLKPFAGMNVIFDVIPDFEAQRAANQIAYFVNRSGWKIDSANSAIRDWLSDGVKIWSHLSPNGSRDADEQKGEMASNALVKFLESFGWSATADKGSIAQGPAYIPVNTIRVQVGFKPNPYFAPPEVKAFEKKAKEMEEKILKDHKRFLERLRSPHPPE
jgi:hypothetical protein